MIPTKRKYMKRYTEEDKQLMRMLYQEDNKSISEVAKIMNRSIKSVEFWLISNKVYKTEEQRNHQKYKTKLDLSCLNTKNYRLDYLVGMIATDGHVTHDCIRVSSKNEDHAKLIASFCNANITHYSKNDKHLYTVSMASQLLANYFLSNYAMPCSPKSFTIEFDPIMSMCTRPDLFLRGLFDGDGYIHPKAVNMNLTTASVNFADQLCSYLNTNVTHGVYVKPFTQRTRVSNIERTYYRVCLNKKPAHELISFMYVDNLDLVLVPKYERAKFALCGNMI